MKKCKDCGGHGRGYEVEIFDHTIDPPRYEDCSACKGNGKVGGFFSFGFINCFLCYGSGKVQTKAGSVKKWSFVAICKTCKGK